MFHWLTRWMQTKASAATRAVIAFAGGRPVWSPAKYEAFAREGYGQNVYVYACVRHIAMACAGIGWRLYREAPGGSRHAVERHPLLALMRRPNEYQGRAAFIEETLGYLLLAGNAYIERVDTARGRPGELYALRPDRVQVIPGDSQHRVGGYRYRVNGQEARFAPPRVLHLRTFNPTDDWYGLSPLQAAARAVDQNNESKAWNVALLQNSARPPGALTIDDNLTDRQLLRLEEMIADRYSGAVNAGRPLLLEGGMRWQHMGLTPGDMDWLQGQQLTAREIAIAFGVPPELLGDTASKTYSNYREARRAFYEETVLPMMDMLRDELNAWLTPAFADDLTLDYNRDDIEALQEDRRQLWHNIQSADFLTRNEKRAALGYPPLAGGDGVE